jgi:hypothetical protein
MNTCFYSTNIIESRLSVYSSISCVYWPNNCSMMVLPVEPRLNRNFSILKRIFEVALIRDFLDVGIMVYFLLVLV